MIEWYHMICKKPAHTLPSAKGRTSTNLKSSYAAHLNRYLNPFGGWWVQSWELAYGCCGDLSVTRIDSLPSCGEAKSGDHRASKSRHQYYYCNHHAAELCERCTAAQLSAVPISSWSLWVSCMALQVFMVSITSFDFSNSFPSRKRSKSVWPCGVQYDRHTFTVPYCIDSAAIVRTRWGSLN